MLLYFDYFFSFVKLTVHFSNMKYQWLNSEKHHKKIIRRIPIETPTIYLT